MCNFNKRDYITYHLDEKTMWAITIQLAYESSYYSYTLYSIKVGPLPLMACNGKPCSCSTTATWFFKGF